MIDVAVAIRVLMELSVLLIGGIIAFLVAWQLRQDKKIEEMRTLLIEIQETAKAIKGLAEHNIPDAWKESDKAKDMLIENLTKLCIDVCAKNR
jgi:gas vesicle protein